MLIKTKTTPITLPLLNKLITSCDDSLVGIRDKAILLLVASSPLRPYDIISLNIKDLENHDDGYLIRVVKRNNILPIYISGRAAHALKTWLDKSKIKTGEIFREIKRNNIFDNPMLVRRINHNIKRYIEMAGLNSKRYSINSLRACFITEAYLNVKP